MYVLFCDILIVKGKLMDIDILRFSSNLGPNFQPI